MVVRLEVVLEAGQVKEAEALRKEVAQQVYAQAGVDGLVAICEAMGNPGYQDWLDANRVCIVAGHEVPGRVASLVKLAGGEVIVRDPAEEEVLEAFVGRQARKRGRKPAPWGGDSDTDSGDSQDQTDGDDGD